MIYKIMLKKQIINLIMKMNSKTPNASSKDPVNLASNTCRIHKEPFTMICLHAGCHSYYKLACVKCKKQKHYQHPNRVIILKDFYEMLTSNKMDFIENSLGLCLVNIKNKLVYVSNFRIFILEKQSMLMQNARFIHSTIFKILQEKQQLKSYLQDINEETQNSQTQKLLISLEEMRKNISFNPIQNVIRINSEKVNVLKVELEKFCQATKTVINDIRQYLVKIVEAMLEEEIQEEDIEYVEHEDVDQKIFNINVKKPNHVELNQKQPRYKVEQLEEMFELLLKSEVEKHEQHIESDVQRLEQQIKFKQEIVKNIRGRSASKAIKNYSVSDEIKETTSPNDKHSISQNSSSIDHISEADNNFSKISLNSPKTKDMKNNSRNIGKTPLSNFHSPKTPKVRSITDKGNTSPKNINTGIKSTNGFNKKSPKSNLKPNLQSSKSQVKTKGVEEKRQKNQARDSQKNGDQMNLSENQKNTECQKIQQSEQQQLLNTETNFNPLNRKNVPFTEDSILLEEDSSKFQSSEKFRELMKQVESLEKENKRLKFDFQQKCKQMAALQAASNQEKIQAQQQTIKLQLEIKELLSKIQKSKVDFIKQNQPLGHSKVERKSPQRVDDKNHRKDARLNEASPNNKKLMDQKKELQVKVQKYEKQIKQLKEKQQTSKKQHQINLQNAKDIAALKKKNQDISKKSDEIFKKNEELSKKNDELTKRLSQQKAIVQEDSKIKSNEANKEKTELMKQIRLSDDKFKSLEEKFKIADQKNKLLEQKIRKSEQKLKQLENVNIEIKAQNDQLKSIIDEQKIRISEIEEKSKNQNESKNQGFQKMQGTVADLEHLLKQKERLISEKDQIIHICQEKINELQSIKENRKQELESKSVKISQIQVQLKRKQNEMIEIRSKNSQICGELQKMKLQYLSLQQSQEQEQSKHLIQVQTIRKQYVSKIEEQTEMIKMLNIKLQQTGTILKENQNCLQKTKNNLNLVSSKLEFAQKCQKNFEKKISQKSLKFEELEQLASKRLGQKIWFKDQEIQRLQNLNKQIKEQLQHLKSTSIQAKKQLQEAKQETNNAQKQQSELIQKIQILQCQSVTQSLKIQKLEEQLQRQKQIEKDQQKLQSQLLNQHQYLKKMYDQQKQRNEKSNSFDIKNYVPLIKHKQLKEWYQIVMKKNQEFKEEIAVLKLQKSQIIQDYETKVKQLTQQNIELLEKTKINSQTDIGQVFPKILGSAESGNSLNNGMVSADTSALALTKYGQIKSIIQLITGDMHLLQEKVKENTVIQKVYLKELDRKRTQNRKLRQQIEDYRNRQRKLGGVRTDRYFQKNPSSKPKNQKNDYKVYYATGFAGSESRLSGGGSTLVHGNHNSNFQDNFISANDCKSTLSHNSNCI